MLKFLLLVNKQGHTRVSQYYEHLDLEERTNMEAEITRKCLARSDDQVKKASSLKKLRKKYFLILSVLMSMSIYLNIFDTPLVSIFL